MKFLFIFLFPFFLSAQSVVDSLVIKHEQIIYFESDEHSLDSADISQINDLVKQAAGSSTYKYFLDAYTDDVGSNEYNLKLSERRKESVLSELKSNGVLDSLIISKFHGEDAPIVENKDEVSRRENRRVSILLLDKIPFIEMEGIVQDEESGEPVETEVLLISKNFSTTTNTNEEGEFSALVPLGVHVVIEVTAKDYFIGSKVIKTTRALIGRVVKLPLPKVELGKTFELENLLFVGDSPQILPKSKSILNQIERFMFVNTETCVEIAGHVNAPDVPPVRLGSFSLNLSIARANAIQDSLVRKGVHPDRVLSRGYGNWQMVFPNAKTSLQAERNRRVELIISSCDSTSSIPNDKFEGDLVKSIFNLASPKKAKPNILDKHYDPLTASSDLSQTTTKMKSDIFSQLKKMADADIDPTKFTYKEILQAFPNLPEERKIDF